MSFIQNLTGITPAMLRAQGVPLKAALEGFKQFVDEAVTRSRCPHSSRPLDVRFSHSGASGPRGLPRRPKRKHHPAHRRTVVKTTPFSSDRHCRSYSNHAQWRAQCRQPRVEIHARQHDDTPRADHLCGAKEPNTPPRGALGAPPPARMHFHHAPARASRPGPKLETLTPITDPNSARVVPDRAARSRSARAGAPHPARWCIPPPPPTHPPTPPSPHPHPPRHTPQAPSALWVVRLFRWRPRRPRPWSALARAPLCAARRSQRRRSRAAPLRPGAPPPPKPPTSARRRQGARRATARERTPRRSQQRGAEMCRDVPSRTARAPERLAKKRRGWRGQRSPLSSQRSRSARQARRPRTEHSAAGAHRPPQRPCCSR